MVKRIVIILSIILIPLIICGVLAVFVFSTKQKEESQKKDKWEKLKSLPYVTWHSMDPKDQSKLGVSIYNEKLAYKGLNLYNPRNKDIANLIDMEGNVLHTWAGDGEGKWMMVEMDNKGNLFAVEKDVKLLKLNWNSNILWKHEVRYHHYLDIAQNGDIYSIAWNPLEVPYQDETLTIDNEYIMILNPDGKVKKMISFFPLMKEKFGQDKGNEERIREHIKEYPERPFDAFHINSIEIIDRNIKGFAQKGNILISVRRFNIIAILDIDKEEIVWSWGENILKAQHHPVLLDNGNIMIFDNFGNDGYSRIVEMNPITREIEWIYIPENPQDFRTDVGGANQKLPNGNLLITIYNLGCVIETCEIDFSAPVLKRDPISLFKTKFNLNDEQAETSSISKEDIIVWEFWNPEIRKDTNARAAIFLMKRFGPKFIKKLPFDKQEVKYLKNKGYFI